MPNKRKLVLMEFSFSFRRFQRSHWRCVNAYGKSIAAESLDKIIAWIQRTRFEQMKLKPSFIPRNSDALWRRRLDVDVDTDNNNIKRQGGTTNL